MYYLLLHRKFRKSLSVLREGRVWNEIQLQTLLDLLVAGDRLHTVYKDHQLKGDMSIYRECHIKHDLLLVYQRDEPRRVVTVVDIGTHDDLFGT